MVKGDSAGNMSIKFHILAYVEPWLKINLDFFKDVQSYLGFGQTFFLGLKYILPYKFSAPNGSKKCISSQVDLYPRIVPVSKKASQL